MGELDVIAQQGYSEITLGGVTRKIGKLTLGDFADFEQYVQEQRKQKILSTARELYPDKSSESKRYCQRRANCIPTAYRTRCLTRR